MAGPFAVNTAITVLTIVAGQSQTVAFSVSNTSGRPRRARARVVPESTPAEWLRVVDPSEQSLADDGTTQFLVQVAPPLSATPVTSTFRLEVIAEDNTDEEYSQSPGVALQVTAPAAEKRPFPWWIPAVAAALLMLVVIGVAVFPRPAADPVVPSPTGNPVVPNVIGKPVNDARREVESVCQPVPCFVVVTRPDRFPLIAGATLVVTASDPIPGTAQPPGSRVTLTIEQRFPSIGLTPIVLTPGLIRP